MTTPYQQPGAPVPDYAAPVDYTSPIPIRKANLGDALASEWTKIRSVRSTMWTLGVMVTLLVGIGFLVAVAVSTTDDSYERNDVLTLGFFGTLLGSICVITLGVLTIASEYGTGLIRTTLTACPNRARVLTAKAIVYFLLVFGVTVVTTLLVGAMHVGMLGGEPDGGQWFRATLGVSLYLGLLGLLSLSVGTILRHSAGAITIMIGVVLLPLVVAMFMVGSSLRGTAEFLLEYSIPSQLGVLYDDALIESGPQGWDPLWIMAGLTACALAGAYASLFSRDV